MTLAVFGVSVGLSLLALLAGAAYWLAHPKKSDSAGDLLLHPLAEGVYIYRGFFSNSAVFVLDTAVVVIDTQVAPRAAKRLRREIEKLTPKPIAYVINTHYHGDHSGGNAAFPEATIIATADTARYVQERDSERVEYANTFGLDFVEVHPTVPPARTFNGDLELQIGDDKIVLMQRGRVETPDACVVWWPRMQALACGDGVATRDYPYLGVPFLDEGLRDDGSWIGYLEAVKALAPEVLVPGHGPALVGKETIARRLDLLVRLMRDLLANVKAELAKQRPLQEIVEIVDRRLARYRRRSDLREQTVSQRFAIYRCINNLLPDRNGRGWWHDFRPSVVQRAPVEAARLELARTGDVHARIDELIRKRRGPLAHAVLDLHLAAHPDDAAAWGRLADLCFVAASTVMPKVDATEYIVLATQAAKKALAIDPNNALGLLNHGAAAVFGGVVLAQPMDQAIATLERALAAGLPSFAHRARARFLVGRAHQAEERDVAADEWYRAMLPPGTRLLFPLVRDRIRMLL
ncbi:MAG: MBL fold metallo-hydrolase [Deltaproteobacteria bacterium]|nr:MBL fold metallo-hydrolase [Deltaproteobacteria bacterium]